MLPRVLIIAGSDPSGGAGIQADIKTCTALGVYAATAITALTAQNTLGVHGIHDVPAAFVGQQIDDVLEDIGADAIKLGMLHRADIIAMVVTKLEHAANIPVILDPVMVAKGGSRLLNPEAEHALKHLLLPLATLITPNIPEAEALLGEAITDKKQMADAARKLQERFNIPNVLVKGGHLEDGEKVTDVLLTGDTVTLFEGKRLHTQHTHGTGCTMASAIACGIARKLPLVEAVGIAHHYVHQAIENAPGFGKGHGPINHMVKTHA